MISVSHGKRNDVSDDVQVAINSEVYSENDPEAIEYTHYSTGSFVTFYDDGAQQTTFHVDDIDQLIEALTYIKKHHERTQGDK